MMGYSPSMVEASLSDTLFAHASIEAGHLDPEDFMRGARHLQNRLEPVAPWLAQAKTVCRGDAQDAPVSTCFMIDDYTSSIRAPSVVIPRLLESATNCGISIDYLVRESAFTSEAHSVAKLVADCLPKSYLRIQEDTDLSVASVSLSDSHGQSPPKDRKDDEDCGPSQAVSPHSICLAAELWTDSSAGRKWSCAFLAAVWQLARLGLLDDKSQAYLTPQMLDQGTELPQWQYLPPVIQVNHEAAPFNAYRTLSILGTRYLTVEAAVRTIMKQVSLPADILQRAKACSKRESIVITHKVAERISYIFVGT
jgi:hypothetical protein